MEKKQPSYPWIDKYYRKLPWACTALSVVFGMAAYIAAPPENYKTFPDFEEKVRVLKEEFKEPCLKEVTGRTSYQSAEECTEAKANDRAKFEIYSAPESFLFLAALSMFVQAIGLGWIQRDRKQAPKP